MTDLGPRTGRQMYALYDALHGRGDVYIHHLFKALFGFKSVRGRRHMQQTLGPYIGRLNKRLADKGLAVRPGDLKRTYRIVAL